MDQKAHVSFQQISGDWSDERPFYGDCSYRGRKHDADQRRTLGDCILIWNCIHQMIPEDFLISFYKYLHLIIHKTPHGYIYQSVRSFYAVSFIFVHFCRYHNIFLSYQAPQETDSSLDFFFSFPKNISPETSILQTPLRSPEAGACLYLPADHRDTHD